MDGHAEKIVFFTSANTGIGFETVRALLQSHQPSHVALDSRSVDEGNATALPLRQEF